MGTAPPSRTRWFAWGCLGLILLYALLLVWYFPWRRHLDAMEVAFTFEDPLVHSASMVFAAPSGWIFLYCGNQMGCYLPSSKKLDEDLWHRVEVRDSISCMTLAGDSLYYCYSVTGPQRKTDYLLARLDNPPDPVWSIRLEDQTVQVMDVAACQDYVYILDHQGKLASYSSAKGEFRWRTELLPQPSQGSSSSTSTNQYQYRSYQGTTTLLAADAAGSVYALLNADTVYAMDAEGVLSWETKLPYQSAATMEHASRLGQIYVLDDSGAVTVLDCATGDIAWNVAGQGYGGAMGLEGLPCVGDDGSIVMFDNNYALVVVESGGQNQRQLTKQFEYGSHLVRLADGGVLMLGNDRLKVLDASGKVVWEHGASKLFGPSYSLSDNLLGLTPDGTVIRCNDGSLYGLRPRKLSLVPANP